MRPLDARWSPWDPEKDPDIVTFLIKIVNRLLTNENQGRKRHREIAMDRELRGEGASDDNPAGATASRLPRREGRARDLGRHHARHELLATRR